MASRVQYACSATPIYTYDDATGLPADVLAQEWGKTFAGSASVSPASYSLTGASATDSTTCTTATALTTPAGTSHGFFVRHTGKDSTGAATSATLTLLRAATAICVLDPGGAIFFPSPTTAAWTATASSGDVVAEWANFD